uniref:HIT domain-containing protein n=1 Tax=Oryza brachyantha TaxID=4533 RepID=J3N5L7_ORYBR
MDPPAGSKYRFGPHEIDDRQVFLSTPHSFAIVNLRPTCPGHILYFCTNYIYMHHCSTLLSVN